MGGSGAAGGGRVSGGRGRKAHICTPPECCRRLRPNCLHLSHLLSPKYAAPDGKMQLSERFPSPFFLPSPRPPPAMDCRGWSNNVTSVRYDAGLIFRSFRLVDLVLWKMSDEANVKILFVGPKDSGKTALANFISEAVQVPPTGV